MIAAVTACHDSGRHCMSWEQRSLHVMIVAITAYYDSGHARGQPIFLSSTMMKVNQPFDHPQWRRSTNLFTIHPDRSTNLFIIHHHRGQPTFLSSTMTEVKLSFYHPPWQSSTHLFIIHHDRVQPTFLSSTMTEVCMARGAKVCRGSGKTGSFSPGAAARIMALNR